jgi:hypothetical protein
MTQRKAPSKPRKINFNNEKGVLKEVAKMLDLDPNDCDIKQSSAPNGQGTAYEITCGRQEYYVMRNHDEFEEAAIEGVKADLQDDPSNFNQDFIQGHIDLKKLAKELHGDVFDSNYDSAYDEAELHPLVFLKNNDLDIPRPLNKKLDEHADAMDLDKSAVSELYHMDPEDQWTTIGEEPVVSNKQIEEVAESLTEKQLRNPLGYLRDIYGDDAAKKAIEIAGIDEDKAAKEAVSTDGPEHFMCHYDGNYDTSPSGFIVWQHN